MACSYQLRSLLNGTPATGGEWTLTNPSTGFPVDLNIDGSPVSISDNTTVIGTTDSPNISFDNVDVGTYEFTYTVSNGGGSVTCEDTSTVTISVIEGVTAGMDANVEVCSNDNTQYYILDLLNGGDGSVNTEPINITSTGTITMTPDGAWYTAGTPSEPWTASFNASLAAAGNTYTATYTVEASDPTYDAACTNCQDEKTVTFTVVAPPDAGIDNTVTVCRAFA